MPCTSGTSEDLLLDPAPFNDIGALLVPTKSIEEICQVVGKMSNGEKYSFLYHHVSPPTIFPSIYSHGKNRKFGTSWLEKYPWLLYSPKLDAVFCGPCSLLLPVSKRRDKGLLVNRPFSNWGKLSITLSNHSEHIYHRECLQDADILKSVIDNPAGRVDFKVNSTIQVHINENKHILRQIVRAIIYLGKQGLPFRGDTEQLHLSKNPGNFLALLKNYAETDEILFRHLNSPRAKNATYLSPKSQNAFIDVIGHDMILADIIEEIKDATWFTVLADEVSSHNVEHLPICLRFVDQKCNIREEFISFVKMERVRAVDIASAIILCIENLGLSLHNLRGQGYDGASTMSGVRSGVQARIREKQPKALYTHCAGHSLNLAILNSCSIVPITNCIDQIKSFTLWVRNSDKRSGLLKAVLEKGTHPSSRIPLLNVCVTRWVENIDGWERFSLAHPFLVKMCEVILYGDSDFPLYNDGSWTPEDKRNALAHMKALETFEFLYSMVTLHRSLFYLKEAAVKLQGKHIDIVSGVSTVMQCCTELKVLRENIDDYSKRIYDHSCRLAEKSGIPVSMPRISQRQQHRSNPEHTSVEDYFKKSIAIPFLDHLISDISSRFTSHSKQAASLQGLLPCNITSTSSFSEMNEVISFYSDDLPNSSILDEELCRWKSKWLHAPIDDRPETLSDSLNQCSPITFPNISTLLKFFPTLPLSSASCERSGSALKRLNNYLRCTQTEQRLTALALIHMNYQTDISVDTACKLFIQKHPRRMEKASLLFE